MRRHQVLREWDVSRAAGSIRSMTLRKTVTGRLHAAFPKLSGLGKAANEKKKTKEYKQTDLDTKQ